MIKKTPLTVCFPGFKGPEKDVHSALDYVRLEYVRVMEEAVPGKELHTHVVAARLRMDMKMAWGDVKDKVKLQELVEELSAQPLLRAEFPIFGK